MALSDGLFAVGDTGKRSRSAVLGWLLASLAGLLGCDTPGGPAASPPVNRPGPDSGRVLQVVATTTFVADLVGLVGRERVAIDCLMPAGIDPHSYKATPRDADRLARADLIVATGLRLEGRLADLLERMGRRRPLVFLGEALPRDRLIWAAPEIPDPHVWLDPSLWELTADPLAEALAKLDPAGAAGYRSSAAAAAAEYRELHARLAERLATIPAERRVLVTAHDAFRYFGRAYGLEVVGVQGVSSESEAGLGDINRLVDLVVTRGIPAVFLETSVSDRNMAALVEGAAARGHRLAVGGRLFADSLGEPGSGGESLASALTANALAIVEALE